jgi:uncharacterized membrane protein YqjE
VTEDESIGAASPPGLRSLLPRLVSALRTRLELATIELEEAKEWEKQVLLLAVLSFYLFTFGVILLTFFILVIIDEAYRVYALGGFALLYLALAVVAALALRRKRRLRPKLFSGTLSELAKDVDLLKPK